MRILLIDDDTATLDVLDFTLTMEDHEVHRATDGRTGVDRARQLRPEVIVLDVMMPGVDGLDTLRQLREDPQIAGTPVVMLSAKALEDDVWAGWQAGADSYLTKPLDVELLIEEIDRVSAEAVPA